MSVRDKVLLICNQELNVAEPTGDDKYIKWFNERVLKTWSFAMNVAWCSIFVTYAGVIAGLTKNEMPLTASCDEGMNWFKNRKQWKDALAYGGKYVPKKGDVVYYSSTRNRNDSTHVGWVESCDGTLMTVIEGNYSDKVKKRTIYTSDDYILGYGVVNFPDEENKQATTNALAGTGVGTGVALLTMNVRTGPGTSYSPIGILNKGKSVEVLEVLENNWLKVVWDIADGGFAYISNTGLYFNITWNDVSFKPKSDIYSVGNIVQFNGNQHYTSAKATKGKSCRPGRAKVTQYAEGASHPYHLIATDDGGSNVYGWVNASDLSPLPQSGYTPWVGKVTASVLNVRIGAGTEYGKLSSWPQLSKGNLIDVLGEVKSSEGKVWYYVNIKGNKGYVHSAYIEKV